MLVRMKTVKKLRASRDPVWVPDYVIAFWKSWLGCYKCGFRKSIEEMLADKHKGE